MTTPSNPKPLLPVRVLAIGSEDAQHRGHTLGFLVAEVSGASLGRVFAVTTHRGDAYRLAEQVTPDTPAIADPIGEAFRRLVAAGDLRPG